MQLNEVIDSFFIESLEGLDMMESGLLRLQPGQTDLESINEVFRAAHSIKGGGGVFGFGEISDFMHGVETLLDQLRNGSRDITPELTALLLEAVDYTRQMLQAARNQQPLESEQQQALQLRIEAILHDQTGGCTTAPANQDQVEIDESTHWKIRFKPHAGMLAKANDPLRMIRELAELGTLTSTTNIEALPDFDDLDPAECYLDWELQLDGQTDESTIKDIFAWVADECDLEISAPDNSEQITASKETEEPIKQTITDTSPAKSVFNNGAAQTNNNTLTSDSIRVSIDKIDSLINLVGELVITQSMLNRFSDEMNEQNIQELRTGLSELIRNTRDLQNSVLEIRMLPISFCFNRVPRLVHDICNKLGKKVHLKLTGEDTELDKTVLERITDPLIHLVRNALDHGFELPETRKAANKPKSGKLELKAFHESGNIFIQVIDDGAGLDSEKILEKAIEKGLVTEEERLTAHQINNLIFHPGLSTADSISDLSGRGVGMDVVKRNINDLGGDVWLESEYGVGTKIHIKLPLTLAILDGQLLRVGKEIYIMPLLSIIESIQVKPDKVNELPGNASVYRLRDTHIPIIRLCDVLSTKADAEEIDEGLLVVVNSDRQQYGIWVDELLDQQQVVIKSLETNFKHVPGVSGATILGDGTVALILDINGIVESSGHRDSHFNLAVA